jgi:hypothetical protein
LSVEPRRDFLRPLCGVYAETLATEVDAFASALAEVAFQRIAVGPSWAMPSFQSDACAARISDEVSSPDT